MSGTIPSAPTGREVCPRCWHDHVTPPSNSEKVRRIIGFRPHRIECGVTSESGPCACRSRFHVGVPSDALDP